MRYRVTKSHKPEKSPPLMLGPGQHVRFERRPTEWKGWLWCTTETGERGWVPEAWVKIDGDICIALREYCSAELEVRVGQEVLGDIIESGWVQVRNDEGAVGWVPLECLESMEE